MSEVRAQEFLNRLPISYIAKFQDVPRIYFDPLKGVVTDTSLRRRATRWSVIKTNSGAVSD